MNKIKTPLQEFKHDFDEIRKQLIPAEILIVDIKGVTLKNVLDNIENLLHYYLPKEKEVIENTFDHGKDEGANNVDRDGHYDSTYGDNGKDYFENTFKNS